jgi:hypothetical protein
MPVKALAYIVLGFMFGTRYTVATALGQLLTREEIKRGGLNQEQIKHSIGITSPKGKKK